MVHAYKNSNEPVTSLELGRTPAAVCVTAVVTPLSHAVEAFEFQHVNQELLLLVYFFHVFIGFWQFNYECRTSNASCALKWIRVADFCDACTSRLMFTAARNEHLPDVLAMVHCRNYTPVPAILLTVWLHGLLELLYIDWERREKVR
jgi:hypothetical protein